MNRHVTLTLPDNKAESYDVIIQKCTSVIGQDDSEYSMEFRDMNDEVLLTIHFDDSEYAHFVKMVNKLKREE